MPTRGSPARACPGYFSSEIRASSAPSRTWNASPSIVLPSNETLTRGRASALRNQSPSGRRRVKYSAPPSRTALSGLEWGLPVRLPSVVSTATNDTPRRRPLPDMNGPARVF